MKDMMFKVLFSRNHFGQSNNSGTPYKSEKSAFASVYPSIAESVEILKSKEHRLLPIYLQKLESHLFIDCIAKELVSVGIIPFTIHDSIIVKKSDEIKTIEMMKDIFIKQTGVIPSFEVKRLNENH